MIKSLATLLVLCDNPVVDWLKTFPQYLLYGSQIVTVVPGLKIECGN